MRILTAQRQRKETCSAPQVENCAWEMQRFRRPRDKPLRDIGLKACRAIVGRGSAVKASRYGPANA